MKTKLLLLLCITAIFSKTCQEAADCINSDQDCKVLAGICFADKECDAIFESDVCIQNIGRSCENDPSQPFPVDALKTCVQQQTNENYLNLWNCAINSCLKSFVFLERDSIRFSIK